MKKTLLFALLLCLMPFLGFSQHLDGVAPVSNPLPGHVQMNLERTRDGAPKVFTHVMYIPTNDQHFGHYYALYDNGDIKDIRIYDGYYFTSAEYYRPYVENPDPGSVDECFPVWTYTDDRTQGWHRLALKNGSDCGSFSPVMNIIRDLTYDYVHNAPGREGRMLGLEYGYISQVNMNWGGAGAGSVDTLYRYTDHDGLYPLAMACDLSGTLYFVNLSEDGESSRLYYFSSDDPDLTEPIEVGGLDWPARFIQTMAFDHQNGDRLYWWQCDGEGKTNLVEVIVEKDEDGMPVGCHTELIADMGHSQMGGMVFEFLYRPYTAFCADNELGTVRLKSGTSYTLTQNDYKPGKPVDFQVTSEESHMINNVYVVRHDNPDDIVCTVTAAQIVDGMGSFAMPAFDVDIVGEWIGDAHDITYEWTPNDVAGLLSGPATGNYNAMVAFNYSTDANGYILTGLAAQSGSGDLELSTLSPDEEGQRQFKMPDEDVTVTGTFEAIGLEQLDDICQWQAPGVPSYTVPEGVTGNTLMVKKPGNGEWTDFTEDDWSNDDLFDVAGTWQYRVELTNDYGTFAEELSFEVATAPQTITLEGETDYCVGGTVVINVVPTPADFDLSEGYFEWFIDGAKASRTSGSQFIIENCSTDDAGAYHVRYTPKDAPCQWETPGFVINVHPLPEVAWVEPEDGAMITGSIELQATPEGGTFYYLNSAGTSGEWEEITGNTFTFPEVGQYALKYYYEDENGCANESEVRTVNVGREVHLIDGTGGTLSLSGTQTIFMPGDPVVVNGTPNDCMHITDITVYKTADHSVMVTSSFDVYSGECTFEMPEYDVDVVAGWGTNRHHIDYSGFVTGISVIACGIDLYLNFDYIPEGSILVGISVRGSCESDIPLTINAGECWFTMPDCDVEVSSGCQTITIANISNFCQWQAPGVPDFNIFSEYYTSYTYKVKKPGSTEWIDFNDDDWADGNNFDVAGVWTYCVALTNDYGTFESEQKTFEVYDVPESIAISGETDYCEGGTITLTAVPDPVDFDLSSGTLTWYQGDMELSDIAGPELTIVNCSTDHAGSYTVTYMVGDNLCQFETDPISVNVAEIPEVYFVEPVNDTIVALNTGSLALLAYPEGGTYAYEDPETGDIVELTGNTFTFPGVGSFELTYSYTNDGGCTGETSITVNVGYQATIVTSADSPEHEMYLDNDSNTNIYLPNETVTFRFFNDDCYTLDIITVSGSEMEEDFYASSGIDYITFPMPDYDVTITPDWTAQDFHISFYMNYQGIDYDPGPGYGNCGSEFTFNFTPVEDGFILISLDITAGDNDVDFAISGDNTATFMMPTHTIIVDGKYRKINLELDDICLGNAPGVPSCNVNEYDNSNYTVQYFVKNPEATDWTEYSSADWENSNNFNVAGTWEYKVQLTNYYGSFESITLNFKVKSPIEGLESISLEVDDDYIWDGETAYFSVVASPNTYNFNGTFIWYFKQYVWEDYELLTTTTTPSYYIEDCWTSDDGYYMVIYYPGPESEEHCEFTAFCELTVVDGMKDDSTITNLDQFVANNELNVSLYPNPTSGDAKIVNDNTVIQRVTVYNLMGQTILDEEVNNTETTLHLNGVALGVYMVKVSTEEGEVMKKMVIE